MLIKEFKIVNTHLLPSSTLRRSDFHYERSFSMKQINEHQQYGRDGTASP